MAKKKLPNKLSMIVNVVLYLRVSSDEQAKFGFSIENQRKECINFADRNSYHVVKVFVDEGKSAKDLNRPEIKEMISYCGKSKNHIDAIIVWRLDRLSRNTIDYHGEIRKFLEKHNIKLLSATESNEETIEGELMRNIGIDFAEYEKKIIGKRTKAAMNQKADLGQYPHKVTIGYKNITNPDKTKSIIIDNDKASYIRNAYQLCTDGKPLALIVSYLKQKGFYKLSKSKLKSMLQNPVYIGKIKFDKKIYKGIHEAIISEQMFNKAQTMLKKKK